MDLKFDIEKSIPAITTFVSLALECTARAIFFYPFALSGEWRAGRAASSGETQVGRRLSMYMKVSTPFMGAFLSIRQTCEQAAIGTIARSKPQHLPV